MHAKVDSPRKSGRPGPYQKLAWGAELFFVALEVPLAAMTDTLLWNHRGDREDVRPFKIIDDVCTKVRHAQHSSGQEDRTYPCGGTGRAGRSQTAAGKSLLHGHGCHRDY